MLMVPLPIRQLLIWYNPCLCFLTPVSPGKGQESFPFKRLIMQTDSNNFPQKVHDLIQAIISACDLHYLSRPHNQSLFHEDIERLLRENEIPIVPDFRFVEKSGLYQSFDFAISEQDRHQNSLLPSGYQNISWGTGQSGASSPDLPG